MSLLDDLGLYLQTEGLGVLGSTLFLGHLPTDAPEVVHQDAVIALTETPGFPTEYTHDVPVGVRLEHPVIQPLIRGAPYDYQGTRARAQDVLLCLGKISNLSLSGTIYLWCRPIQSVFPLDPDDNGRPVMTFQARIAKAV